MHMAAVFQRILKPRNFRDRTEKAMGNGRSGQTIARLAALVFPHDIGKLPPVFGHKIGRPGGGASRYAVLSLKAWNFWNSHGGRLTLLFTTRRRSFRDEARASLR